MLQILQVRMMLPRMIGGIEEILMRCGRGSGGRTRGGRRIASGRSGSVVTSRHAAPGAAPSTTAAPGGVAIAGGRGKFPRVGREGRLGGTQTGGGGGSCRRRRRSGAEELVINRRRITRMRQREGRERMTRQERHGRMVLTQELVRRKHVVRRRKPRVRRRRRGMMRRRVRSTGITLR